MEDREIKKMEQGVVFEKKASDSEDSVFVPIELETRTKLREFYSPLFHRKLSKSGIYWIIFLLISAGSTGGILYFIRSFAGETERFQKEMTTAERYRLMYGDIGEDESTTTSPHKKGSARF